MEVFYLCTDSHTHAKKLYNTGIVRYGLLVIFSIFFGRHFYHVVKKNNQKKARASEEKNRYAKKCAKKESDHIAR